MALTLKSERRADAVLITLTGRLTIGDATDEFRTAIHEAIAAGDKKFIVDLSGVVYVDSSGLGELVSGMVAARREGGDLELAEVPPRIKDLLHVSKVYTAFRLVSLNRDDHAA